MSKVYSHRGIGIAEIQIVIGDIVQQSDMDAIVNAANSKLLMGSGVCGAIFRAADSERLTKACTELAPINVGEAVITSGFNLPNRFIIHSCGPHYEKNQRAEEELKFCYIHTLKLAERSQVSSLAVPAISTGAYGFPTEDATRICIRVIKEISPKFKNLKIIRFVVRDEKTAKIYDDYLQENIQLPNQAVKVDFHQQFSPEEFLRLRKGFIGDQDAKWFFYFDEPWLYIFRGGRWADNCFWFVKFAHEAYGYRAIESWVNSEIFPEQGYEKWLCWLVNDYYLGETKFTENFEYTPLDENAGNGYSVLSSGRVVLSIKSKPFFSDEIRSLGSQLIRLADKLDSKQLIEK